MAFEVLEAGYNIIEYRDGRKPSVSCYSCLWCFFCGLKILRWIIKHLSHTSAEAPPYFPIQLSTC